MSKTFPPSELIINPDGSIYHLNIKPGQIAETVITVGDPERVKKVTAYFDKIEWEVSKREFFTQTGTYKGKRITVISTGIGTDNIDIVFNELDALVNIDFETRQEKEQKTSLNLIRIGTSGSMQDYLEVDSFLVSVHAVGLDALMHYYDYQNNEALIQQIPAFRPGLMPYSASASPELIFSLAKDMQRGITVTAPGFYGPQGRALRSKPFDEKYLDKMREVKFEGLTCTNLEMETAGIYGLASQLGHRAISFNALLANRVLGKFSERPAQTVDVLIQDVLSRIEKNLV